MSGTLASLIRQHQLNPKTLYAAPETERESAPGEYDRTGSQKSPYLERLVEQETARKVGEDSGLNPDDLDDVGGFDDLEDLLDDKKTDPTGGDPTEDPTEPLNPVMPGKDDPGSDDPEIENPTPIEGLRAFVLHGGSISYTHDGGAHWKQFEAPSNPIGFAVTGQGIYVATDDGIHFSANLSGWTELPFQDQQRQAIGGFSNGSFESGITGWELMSGLEPRATWLEHIIPTDGSNYLTRDWLFFTDSGAFEVGQEVTLSADERAQIGTSYLSFSADVFCEGGSVELRIDKFGESTLLVADTDRIEGSHRDSDPLSELEIVCSGMPATEATAQVSFTHDINWPNYNPSGKIDLSMSFRVRLGGAFGAPVYTSSVISQTAVPIAEAIIREGAFQIATTFTLTGSSGGTIEITVPVGWRYPILIPQGLGHGSTSVNSQYALVEYGTGWTTIASASSSDYGWNRIAADVYSLTSSSQIRCTIKGSGSPADVCIDNARLELVGLPMGAHVTAISGDEGGAFAAINGQVYKLSPSGMQRAANGWSINPTGLLGGSIGWEGSTIATGEGEIEAPGTVAEVVSGGGRLVVTTTGGVVYVRDGDGWNDPFGDSPVDGQICYEPMRGIFLLFNSSGYLIVSRDAGGWEQAWTLPGGYTGEFHAKTVGRRVLIWAKDRPMLWWLDSNACKLGGIAPAGILDISGR